jgi:hypothetical protein
VVLVWAGIAPRPVGLGEHPLKFFTVRDVGGKQGFYFLRAKVFAARGFFGDELVAFFDGLQDAAGLFSSEFVGVHFDLVSGLSTGLIPVQLLSR